MRNWLFLLMIFCCTEFLQAQTVGERQIYNSSYIPSSVTQSSTSIAEYVKNNFKTDIQKVSAIYRWVTLNIRYDNDSANIINLGVDQEAKVTAALRRRRGVCENYAAIFNEICLKSGLTSFVVDGYTKQGSIDKTGHAWCVVKIDSNWLLCDPTWDVGGYTKYFLVEPYEMIATHMPYDPMWQLLNYPVTHQQFYSGNIYEDRSKQFFNYPDSIAAYTMQDSLQKYKSSAKRIEQNGLYNNMVKNKFNYNKMQVEIIRQDKDVDLYNSSVADLNMASGILNSFVQFRNNQFTPAISDNALQAMLEGIETKILSANKNLDEIGKSEAVFTFSTDAVSEKLNLLTKKVIDQREFLQLYLNTSKANRQSLFYTKQLSGK